MLIVVDQLGWKLFDELAPSYTGGFKRFIDDGFVGTGRHAHANTLTCPGHATIATGTAPSVNGIIGNEWRLRGQDVYCADPSFLRVPGLSEVFTRDHGSVVAMSLKDRGAILLGGTAPTEVAWWDSGAFVGHPDAPWVHVPVPAATWTARRPDLYAQLGASDDQPWEGDAGGLGRVFPHAVDPAAKSFLATANAGTALTDEAIAAIDADHLGTRDTPDLLTVSYSQIDYIGHAYTMKSWEALDGMLALDADLGRLFDHLDASVGRDRWVAVLSADHGSAPPAEKRFALDDVTAAADAALVALGDPAGAAYDSPTIWLPEVVRADPAARSTAAKAVAARVSAIDGVTAYAWREPDGLPADFPYADALKLAFDDERSGDVYVLYDKGVVPGAKTGVSTGTSHGTPYDYDQLVPFLAVGPGVAHGTGATPIDTRRIAATTAALVGLAMPAPAMSAADEVLHADPIHP